MNAETQKSEPRTPTIGSIDDLLQTQLKQLATDAQGTSNPAIAEFWLRVGWTGLAAAELFAIDPAAPNEAFLQFAGRVRFGFGGLKDQLGHPVNIEALEESGFSRTPLLGEFYRLAQAAHTALEAGGNMPAPTSPAQSCAVSHWRTQVASRLTPRQTQGTVVRLTSAMPRLSGELTRAMDDGQPLIPAPPTIPTKGLQKKILRLLLNRRDRSDPGDAASLTTGQIQDGLNYTGGDGRLSEQLSELVKTNLLLNEYHTTRRPGYRLTALGRQCAQRLVRPDAMAGASPDH